MKGETKLRIACALVVVFFHVHNFRKGDVKLDNPPLTFARSPLFWYSFACAATAGALFGPFTVIFFFGDYVVEHGVEGLKNAFGYTYIYEIFNLPFAWLAGRAAPA